MAMAAMVTQDDDDKVEFDAKQQQVAAAAPCCVACQAPLPRGSSSLCSDCLDAARCCVDDIWEGGDAEEKMAADDESNCRQEQQLQHLQNQEPFAPDCVAAQPMSASTLTVASIQNISSPEKGEAVAAITVKSPGRLIQEKFLAACARGEVVELLFSQESPGSSSSTYEIIDVRSPSIATIRNNDNPSDGNASAQLFLAGGASLSDKTRGSVDDDDDCEIVGVQSTADQIQARFRQAEASGNMISRTMNQSDYRGDQEGAINRPNDSSNRSVDRKRPAHSNYSSGSNPQGGPSPQIARSKRQEE